MMRTIPQPPKLIRSRNSLHLKDNITYEKPKNTMKIINFIPIPKPEPLELK